MKNMYKAFILSCLINITTLCADDLGNSFTKLETALSSLAATMASPNYQDYLRALESVYLNLFNFEIAQDKPRSVPLTENDTDFFKTELNELNKNMLFFITNQAALSTEQIKQVENFAIQIKDEMVNFLASITELAYESKNSNKAITILGYISEFYTQGVAQPAYRMFLGDMQESDKQIEELKEAMRAQITPPSTPVPVVPTPDETPAPSLPIELTPMPSTPAPSLPIDLTPMPSTPAPTPPSPEPSAQAPQFIKDINAVSVSLSKAFADGDTEIIYEFMSNKGSFKTKGFDYYQQQITANLSELTEAQKQTATNFTSILETGINSPGMNTLTNKDAYAAEIKALQNTLDLD